MCPFRYQPIVRLSICLLASLIIFGCQKEQKHTATPPYSPQEALTTFELANGFRIEAVAAEPLIADPVAMEIDEAGNMYVVEMHGYPLDKSGSGKIKILKDTDGDGRMDKSILFAEGLTLPTGIMRWKNGVIVTDAPDVLYLEDKDGDGKADVKKTLLSGFALSNPQHNLNTPVYGLDNWIYLAHESSVTTKLFPEKFGDEGQEIVFPGNKQAPRLPKNAASRNVRFRPDTYELEVLSGKTQFGQTFDTWGHHFLVSNARHLYQEVLPARYVQRNPDLLIADATQSIPDHGDAAEVYPVTKNPEHQLLTDVGVITSACGVTCYLGGAFPETFNEAVFVGEPVHNLVHVDQLTPKGASFTGSRMYPDQEFLASTDSWFRPVNFYVGPDGALYVLDYYRQIIEHPEWMSEEVNQSGALYNGTDKGRIYRIVPENFSPDADKTLLAGASVATLVKALEKNNLWWRKTAQRLLVDKKSPASIELLEQMARESAYAPARLHALWTLEGIGKLDTSLIIQALHDTSAGVRENAIKLAEMHLQHFPALAAHLFPLTSDQDAKVRYQLLCTLGEISGEQASSARKQLLFAGMDDEWVHLAALSSPQVNPVVLFEETTTQIAHKETEGHRKFIQQLCAMTGKRNRPEEISRMLQVLTAAASQPRNAWWSAAGLQGFAQGMRGHTYDQTAFVAEKKKLLTNFYTFSPDVRQASLKLIQLLGLPGNKTSTAITQKALAVANSQQADGQLRADAIRLLALAEVDPYINELQNLVRPEEPAIVQQAAVQALSQTNESEISTFLLSKWQVLTPDIRDQGVDVLMKNPARIKQLLNGIEKGIVQPSAIGWRRSVSLMNHSDASIRAHARKLLDEKPALQEEVLNRYQAAFTLSGNLERGKTVFEQVCASCHQMGGSIGKAIGPDLASVKNRKPEAIMQDILLPNRSIADGYEWWEIKEKDGKETSGILANETAGTLTLRNLAGQETTVERNNIETLHASDASVMPSGLEKQINEQKMADLLAFIKQYRIGSKQVSAVSK